MIWPLPKPACVRWLGVSAAAAYAMPLAVSLATFAMHDLYHLREHFGYVSSAELARLAAPGEFEHSHGDGVRHHHDSATDALLAAAQRTDDPADQHQAPSLELAGHLPAQVATLRVVVSVDTEPTEALNRALPLTSSPPPLPPPRA